MPSRSKIDARTPVRTISSVMKGEPSTSFTSVRAEPVAPVPTTLSLPVQPRVRAPIQPITSRSTRKIPALTSTTSTSSSGSGINTDSITDVLKKGIVGALGVTAGRALLDKLLAKQEPAPIERRDTTQKPAPIENKSNTAVSGAYDEYGNLNPGWQLNETNDPVFVGVTQTTGQYFEDGEGNVYDANGRLIYDAAGPYQRQDQLPELDSVDQSGNIFGDVDELDDSSYYNNYYSYKQGGNVDYEDSALNFADGGETLSENFNTDAYLALNPDVVTGIEAYRAELARQGLPDQSPAELARQHYLLHGKTEGRRAVYRSAPATSQTSNVSSQSSAATPSASQSAADLSSSSAVPFNAEEYLANNPDVARYVQTHLNEFGGDAAKGALAHATKYGADEKRLTSTGAVYDRNFDAAAYLRNNPDVARYINANLEMFGNDPNRGALEHYLTYGQQEQRAAPVRAGGLGQAGQTGGTAGGQAGGVPAGSAPTMDFGYIPSRTTDFGPGMTGGRTGTGSVFVPYQEYSQGMEYNPYQQLYANLGVSGYLDNNQPVVPSQRPYQLYPQYQDEGYGDGRPYPSGESPIQPSPYVPYHPEQAMADGGSTHYTYGKVIDPADNLDMSMKRGGLSHTVPSHHENPVVNNRIDFKKGAAVNGAGDGQSDDIPAWLADGEYVMDAELVSMLGNGSNKAGAKILDEFREQVRAHKRNAPLGKIPPKAKSPLNYLKEALNG